MTTSGRTQRIADLTAFGGAAIGRLPWVLRILLENTLRHEGSDHRYSRAILSSGREEIPFYPTRLLMHDTTCVPALVDIAALRSVLSESGWDASQLNPVLPVDVSVDHSIAVDTFGTPDALKLNMQREIERNEERYRLLKWATRSLRGLRVHPPGTGIMHTMNLERLATVVEVKTGADGCTWTFPDTLIGTDSHTPMINGIGVLAWGVGGLEAESVMFGMPVMLQIPEVVGVKLTGALPEGTLATDLALTVTQRLRTLRLTGKFVEFFGPGVSSLACGERAVIANMAPEYGASCGFFAVDEATLQYLRTTGRPPELIRRVAEYCKRQRMWFEPDAEPGYDDIIEIDLSAIRLSLAGPRRPQDRVSSAEVPSLVPPASAVAIAAITSCTNTSDPRLTVAAGLLARRARSFGLKPRPWVKTSFAPGSPAAQRYLQRSGLLNDLEAIGFSIVGFGCTTCIGNSGGLTPDMTSALATRGVTPVAVLSGNRNFPGRVHPLIENSFLASPPLVIAYALAGDVNRDIVRDPIDAGIYLRDIWPTGAEIDAAVARSVRPEDFAKAYDSAEDSEIWQNLPAPGTTLFPWDAASTYIRRPPFASLHAQSRLGSYVAHPILVLGDDITTDHISPAGEIPAGSESARHLVSRGADPSDLNVFAARRGNWEVMLRGLFTNRSVNNLLGSHLPAGTTIHAESGAVLSLLDAAERYRAAGEPVIVLAGERYGTGSSRDWAAKGLWLLGVRAVLALSFERIHRSNLIGMGILPLVLPAEWPPERLEIVPGDLLQIVADPERLSPGAAVKVCIRRATGKSLALEARAAVETALEIQLLKDGGILPHILHRFSKGVPPHEDSRTAG